MTYQPLLRFPSVFYIEPTNDCNLDCVMCPRRRATEPIGYMPFQAYCGVVDQLAGRNIVSLNLHLGGEPLMHPQICEMIRHAKALGMPFVRLATNATLLNSDLAEALVDSGLNSITFSMDTTLAMLYCPGKRKMFSSLDANIVKLIEVRNQRDRTCPEVVMNIIGMKQTESLIDEYVKKWTGIVDAVRLRRMVSWAGNLRVPRQYSPGSRFVCNNLLEHGVIHWNCVVSFCCLIQSVKGKPETVLGNAKDTPIADIFLGERRRALIEAQLRGNYDVTPTCKSCPDWDDYLLHAAPSSADNL